MRTFIIVSNPRPPRESSTSFRFVSILNFLRPGTAKFIYLSLCQLALLIPASETTYLLNIMRLIGTRNRVLQVALIIPFSRFLEADDCAGGEKSRCDCSDTELEAMRAGDLREP